VVRGALVLVTLVTACGRLGFPSISDGGGVVGDGPGGPDATSSTPCSGPTTLTDNFDDGVAGPDWNPFTFPGMTAAESGGELVLTLPAVTTSSNYGGYDSKRYFDLRDSRMFVEVTQTTSPAGHAQTYFGCYDFNNANSAEIVFENGELVATLNLAGNFMTIGNVAYDPVAHRWWQIRESQGTLYFEASSDGITYTAIAAVPTPSFVSAVGISLTVGTYQNETATGTARFDNLNGGNAPVGGSCKASTLRDDFNAGAIGAQWVRSFAAGGCTNSETGGNVVMTHQSNASSSCGLVGPFGYDLTDDAIFVGMVGTPTVTGPDNVYLAVIDASGQSVSVDEGGNMLQLIHYVGGTDTTLSSVPYDPVQHRYFRPSSLAASVSSSPALGRGES
jgi:hypothetical protein